MYFEEVKEADTETVFKKCGGFHPRILLVMKD
jgi:hypothetical protein